MEINREQIRTIYETKLTSKNVELSSSDPQLAYILRAIPTDLNIHVLDAGCGDGRYSIYLHKLGYNHLYAVDLFSTLNVPGIEYKSASIDELPYEDSFFDFIFCNSVIFYVDPPEKALVEFHRVLKKGATIVITAHTKWSLFTLWRTIKRDIFKLRSMNHLLGVKFYSAKYYRKTLAKNGFELVLIDGWRFSFIIYPMYHLVWAAIRKITNLTLPVKKPYIIETKWIRRIKSELSYHSVLIAKKI